MTITAPAHESPKRSLCKAIAAEFPDHRVAVYYNRIEIGKHTLKCTPDLREWIWGIGDKPVNVKLERDSMTAYTVPTN